MAHSQSGIDTLHLPNDDDTTRVASAARIVPAVDHRSSGSSALPAVHIINTPPQVRSASARLGHAPLLGAENSDSPMNSYAPIEPVRHLFPSRPHTPRSNSDADQPTPSPLRPPGAASPGSHTEPKTSISLHEGVSYIRVSSLDDDAAMLSLQPMQAPTMGPRRPPAATTSRLAIPSMRARLIFHRRFSFVIWILTVAFFLFPIVGLLSIHFGSSAAVPPSTSHHKRTDGPFYDVGVRDGIGAFGAVYFTYVLLISWWSLRRASFFPFRVRPLFLVGASTFWSMVILVWAWSRYALSDLVSFDAHDGLFPPCIVSQIIVGVAQFALILPYILRAWQLARIFGDSPSEFATQPPIGDGRRGETEHRQQRSGEFVHGVYIPASPSMHSRYSEDLHAIVPSAESTPRLAPQPARSPSRAFLTSSLTTAPSNRAPSLVTTTSGSQMVVARTPPQGRVGGQWTTPRRRTHGPFTHTISSHPSSPTLDPAPRAGQMPSPDASPMLRDQSFASGFVAPSPLLAHDGRSLLLPNFPSLDHQLLPAALADAQLDTTVDASSSSSSFAGCLDNLHDHKLAMIYLCLLLPLLALTVLSAFLPSLEFLTNFECTNDGPPTTTARYIWVAFGLLELVAFALGLYATRRVWDGFEIRRELLLSVGMQSSIILVSAITIVADEMTRNRALESSSLREFHRLLAVIYELLVILRSILLFHVSVALPLVESYDLNALPVNKARMRLGGSGGIVAPELQRDAPFDVHHAVIVSSSPTPTRAARIHRADSRSSDFSMAGSANSTSSVVDVHAIDAAHLRTALLADLSPSMPLSSSNLARHSDQLPRDDSATTSSIPLTLEYIISHPEYFSFFVAFVSQDAHMEILWEFFISIVLFQDMEGDTSEPERKEMAQKIYHRFFCADPLSGASPFSQWLLSMANILQHEYCLAHGTAVSISGGEATSFLLGEREQAQAIDRVDEEIERIARLAFDETTESAPPRDVFDDFHHASFTIMAVWFFPKFLRSRYYRALIREIEKTTIIQARIQQAHGGR